MGTNWMKGLTREQITAKKAENDAKARYDYFENPRREQRLADAGWDDLTEMLKLLHSYDPLTNPYSFTKFCEDTKLLDARKEAIASGQGV